MAHLRAISIGCLAGGPWEMVALVLPGSVGQAGSPPMRVCAHQEKGQHAESFVEICFFSIDFYF